MNLAGHTADGQYNFTSIGEPSQIVDVTESGSECEAQRDVEEKVSRGKMMMMTCKCLTKLML